MTHWPLFWWGLATAVAVVLAYFLWAFRDRASATGAAVVKQSLQAAKGQAQA